MSHIEFESVTPNIGAEVRGIDLKRVGPEEVEALKAALLEHQVLFFRDQPMEPAEQKALAENFGTPGVHAFLPNFGDDLACVSRIETDGTESKGSFTDRWHHDETFLQSPSKGSILQARILPPKGGDTSWASMYAAYDALSGPMQRICDELVAVHDMLQGMCTTHPTQVLRDVKGARKAPEPIEQPVVRVHPETGRKLLFVNPLWTSHIKDMTMEESRAILDFLYRHVAAPEFQVRLRWKPFTVAFWDNRACQHYAIHDFHGQRVMHRVTLEGDRPEGVSSEAA